MSVVRRTLQDRGMTYALAGLAVFSMAFVWFVSHSRVTEARDDLLVRAVEHQIANTHEAAATALLVATGATPTEAITELRVDIDGLQRALRIGDTRRGLRGASSVEEEILLADAQPAAQGLLDALDRTERQPTLASAHAAADAGAEMRAALEPVRALYLTAATEASVRAAKIQIASLAAGLSVALGIAMFMGTYTRKRGALSAALARGRQQLRRQVDPLTGLPKRSAFRDVLIQAAQRTANDEFMVGLLVVAIDRSSAEPFPANDPHLDPTLRSVAAALRETVRSTDTVARSGRDQFSVLVDIRRSEDAGVVADKLIAAAQRVRVGDIAPVASVGIAVAPHDAERADDLMRSANAALADARRSGGGTFAYPRANVTEHSVGALHVIDRLERALRTGEGLWLAYQPKVSIEDHRVVGYEALIRWTDAELGELVPEDFIPLAEQSDLIISLGNWVLEEACRQLASWRMAGRTPLPVAVNVSPRQIRHGAMATTVAAELERYRIDPKLLEIEITEAVLLSDDDKPLSRIRDLRGLGVSVSVDDFGTGYSSLGYLKRFPVDAIKIDRSFVQGLGRDPSDRAIASAIVALGHSLGLRVVAEGVETLAQLDELEALGCDQAQGFLFSEPTPASRAARSVLRPTARRARNRSLSFEARPARTG